ncbi:MAG: hypothetical protein HY913_18175 [Desulfomonile tiedjei]|nr:hypothetical protein [Desulfomonile tiedjei]
MTLDATTHEDLLGAFRAMSKEDRHALLESLSTERQFREDLAQILVMTLKAFRAIEDDALFKSVAREVAKESDLLEDLLDSILIIERSNEPSQSFREYLAGRSQ